jgi:hypothetical protein
MVVLSATRELLLGGGVEETTLEDALEVVDATDGVKLDVVTTLVVTIGETIIDGDATAEAEAILDALGEVDTEAVEADKDGDKGEEDRMDDV